MSPDNIFSITLSHKAVDNVGAGDVFVGTLA